MKTLDNVMEGIKEYLEDCGINVYTKWGLLDNAPPNTIMVKMVYSGIINVAETGFVWLSYRSNTPGKSYRRMMINHQFDLSDPDSLGNLVDAIRERLS